MFAYSFDEEGYRGKFETVEQAIAEAIETRDDGERIWIGECVPPPDPEFYWSADDWLEHVSCQEDYSHDWSDDWDRSTNEQKGELEAEVQKVLGEWLDRHGLRPNFYTIENPVEYAVQDGKAVKVDRGASQQEVREGAD